MDTGTRPFYRHQARWKQCVEVQDRILKARSWNGRRLGGNRVKDKVKCEHHASSSFILSRTRVCSIFWATAIMLEKASDVEIP